MHNTAPVSIMFAKISNCVKSAAKFAAMHITAPGSIMFAKISNCGKSATAIET